MYIKHRNLIFSLAIGGIGLVSEKGFSSHIDYSSRGIADDHITRTLRAPRPLSVTQVIELINASPHRSTLKSIDLKNNSLTLEGATNLLRELRELPNLQKINLSKNYLYDLRDNEIYEDFEQELVSLLNKPNFKELDLRTNAIANEAWITYFASRFGMDKARKIKW